MEVEDTLFQAGVPMSSSLKLLCVYGIDSHGQECGYALDVVQQQMNGFCQMKVVSLVSLDDFKEQVASFQPQITILMGAQDGDLVNGTLGQLHYLQQCEQKGANELSIEQLSSEFLAECFHGSGVETVIIAAPIYNHHEYLRLHGVQNVIHWEPSCKVYALSAYFFLHAFFGLFKNTSATIQEAYEVAIFSVQVHCGRLVAGEHKSPPTPKLNSDKPPCLPNNVSIPMPEVPGINFSKGVQAAIAGWENMRLLAPRAEVKMVVCGCPQIIEATRLGFLGQSLRAILAMETRFLKVKSITPCQHTPTHLPIGCRALKCEVEGVCGSRATVLLGGPQEVLSHPSLVEHALRHTLMADALSLQFRLPAPGVMLPQARCDPNIAYGMPVVDTLAVTSVWTVQMLHALCKDSTYRGLLAVGVVGIGSQPVTSLTQTDYLLFTSIVNNYQVPPQSKEMNVEVMSKINNYSTQNGCGGRAHFTDIQVSVEPWQSARQPLEQCSEADFLADLMDFLERKDGRKVNRSKFPEAILNGTPLDLFNLYKSVVDKGGFGMSNQINWKGTIFPQMSNWTPTHRMTGVGNALKKHYLNFLSAYEQANFGKDVSRF